MQVKKGEKKKAPFIFFLFFQQTLLSILLCARAVAGDKMIKSSVHVVLTSEWIKRDNKLVNKPRCNTGRW